MNLPVTVKRTWKNVFALFDYNRVGFNRINFTINQLFHIIKLVRIEPSRKESNKK